MALPNSPLPAFSAVLIAGGRSSRMGTDKAALPWGGQPLWRHRLACLQETNPSELVISGKPDGSYVEAGCPIIDDLTPDAGPLGGLQAALRVCSRDWLLVLAVDLPDVPASFLVGLVKTAVERGRGQVPVHADWRQPLAAVYPRAIEPWATECLAAGRLSLRRFVDGAVEAGLLEMRDVSDHEYGFFRNLNTPDDLSTAQS